MNDQDSKTAESVTILLKTKRYKINKNELINKSRYFAALLSTNYSDHQLSEHVINYEIPSVSFQDFIAWINSDNGKNIACKNNLGRLLILLEMSILFAADNLTQNITDILEEYYMLPEEVLNIWLLAQDLGLNTLCDLSLAVCLDCFSELPSTLIFKLSKQNFLKLVGNINLRIAKDSDSYLLFVVNEWMRINQDTISLDILKKTGPKVYPSFILCDKSDTSSSEFYIHCWNGEKFFELATFKYPESIIRNKNKIIGMQIIGRGHNIYLIGGEFGIGSGRFNTYVWSYSLISKNWIIKTIMPCARRHMIAAFVQNALFLAGGVGHYRRKLRSFDIYNIHEDVWSKGTDLPFEFVTPPDYYVFERKLIIYDRYTKTNSLPIIYIYNFKSREWHIIQSSYQMSLYISDLQVTVPKLTFNTATCYIDIKPDTITLKTIVVICDLEYNSKIFDKITTEVFGVNMKTNCNIRFYLILAQDDLHDSVLLCAKDDYCILIRLIGKEHSLHHSLPSNIQDPNKFHLLSSNTHTILFNLMDPANLHHIPIAKSNST